MSTAPETTESSQNSKMRSKKKYPGLIILALIILIIVLIRPGVFTIQPIGALPDGVTLIYHSRSSEMPFFSSPDGMCIKQMGGVSLLCRMAAIGAADELTNRILIRLPYSQWAYLRSTDGQEFEH